MKILVTGGAGFLGSNLVDSLLQAGHEITVIDNFITGSRKNLESLEEKIRIYETGIEGSDFVNFFLSDTNCFFDQIYHLACPTGVPNIEKLGEEMMDACSAGTKNVLELAMRCRAKVLFTSSCEIYGEPQVTPQGENYNGNVAPQGLRSSYEEGKRFSEALAALFVRKHGLSVVTARPFNVYGTKMSVEDQRVVPQFVLQALRGRPLIVHGRGEQTRTMCYVSDAIRALMLLMEKADSGGIYNVGSDQEITMLELAKKVLAVSGSKSSINFAPRYSHDHNARRPDLTKLYSLGWRRKVELEEGLKLTLDFFSGEISF